MEGMDRALGRHPDQCSRKYIVNGIHLGLQDALQDIQAEPQICGGEPPGGPRLLSRRMCGGSGTGTTAPRGWLASPFGV